MSAQDWSQTLQGARIGGRTDDVLARETLRRTAMGLMSMRDLRMALLVGPAPAPWREVRGEVLALLDATRVRGVLLLHTQIELWPPIAFVDAAAGGRHSCAASVGLPGSTVYGPVRRGASRQEARDAAQTSLLAVLAGATDPSSPHDSDPSRARVQPGEPPRGQAGLGMEKFEALIEARRTHGQPGQELEAEVLERVATMRFHHRHLHRLLLRTPASVGWEQVRSTLLDAVAQEYGLPTALLAIDASIRGGDKCAYEESTAADGRVTVVARFDADAGQMSGYPRSAWARKGARHRATVSLLARLTALPEPPVRIPDEPEPDHQARVASPADPASPGSTSQVPTAVVSRTNALMELNQLKMDKAITKPDWSFEASGPAHQRDFTAYGTCTTAGRVLTGVGRGATKAAARLAAAEHLLTLITAQPAEPSEPAAPVLVPAPRSEAEAEAEPEPAVTSPLTVDEVAAEALAAGCALTTLTDRPELLLYRADGTAMPRVPLPEGMEVLDLDLVLASRSQGVHRATVTGWCVPAADVLPALLAAPADGAHPSTTAWAALARLALRMLADRLVHPDVDERGRDTWRLGPWPQALAARRTALTAALPPHAHCQHAGPADGPTRITTADHAADTFTTALADVLLRPAGAQALLGPVPYARSAPALLDQPMQQWADTVAGPIDRPSGPRIVLAIQEPAEADAALGRLRLVVQVAHPDGTGAPLDADTVWRSTRPDLDTPALRRHVRRQLRRAHDLWPPAGHLANRPAPARLDITAAQAIDLRRAAQQLTSLGVDTVWPTGLADALTTTTAVGTRPVGTGHTGLGLDHLVDFRWRIALRGQDLTDEEMDQLADAARPLVRLRGTWVLVDEATTRRAADRDLQHLTGIQALTAALTGTVTVAGSSYPCHASDALARMVTALRAGDEDHDLLPVPDGLNATLRAYQHRGLTWLARTTGLGFGAILADDMGLGKTVTAIALALHRRQAGATGPTLVLARSSIVTNWVREINAFAPRTPVIAYHGTARTLEHLTPDSIVVTTYGVLLRDTSTLAATTWDLVAADEAQFVNNAATATSHALRQLPASARVAITGTPIENRLEDLRALMDWANPGLLGTREAFRTRFGRAAEADPDGEAARTLRRLTSPFVLRRLKSDPGVAPDLPAKITAHRIVQLTREQAGLYEAAIEETLTAIRAASGIKRRGLVVKLLTSLRQICNHPAHYLKEPAKEAVLAPGFAGRSGKLTGLDELLEEIAGEQTLLFTSYVEMGRLLKGHLAARGHSVELLHGATSATSRQRMVDAFQAGNTRLLILSIKAAGFGLNLTAARHVVHVDQQWNPAVEDQATDRAHRIGQNATVTVHHLSTEATLEDRIGALLQHKRALSQAVLTGGEAALAALTDDELLELVTLGRTANDDGSQR